VGQDSVRATAAWALERTLGSATPVDTWLSAAHERFEDRDRALLSELVLGSLRWLARIDAVIEAASSRRLPEIDPGLHDLLRIGAYQLLFLDRVPPHAVVNEAVEHAQRATHRGGASFTNAVLRRISRNRDLADWPVREADPVRRLAIELSHPLFLVERWIARFGLDRTRALLEANNRPKPLQLLAFRDRGGRELLAEELIDAGLEVEPSSISPLGLAVVSGNPFATAAFREGRFYVQDEASQVAALVPPPRPGERIFDAAAAPGGKSFALAALEPSLRPLLADVDPGRLAVLRANLERLGRRWPLIAADAAAPPFAAEAGGTFDRVVLDLPCTGTGTLRKHPELKWRVSAAEVARLARQAISFLGAAAPLVAPGGRLVAITCSLEAEENEDAVAQFLAAHRDFAPVDLAAEVSSPLDRYVRGPGLWRIFPAGHHDGFTVSVLERVDGRPAVSSSGVRASETQY
jgi:16S rRNA (cytosine967-C5)-methyltransferase